MKEPKKRVLNFAIPGVFISISLSCLILFTANYTFSMLFSSPFLIVVFLSCLFSFFSALVAVYLQYKNANNTQVIQALPALYILPIVFWIPAAFLGSLLALNIWFYITVISGTALVTFFLTKRSKPIAWIFGIVTTFIVLTLTITNFEESYCWNKGEQADPSGTEYGIATKEDAELLKSFEVREGSKIPVSFREHMRCHENFQISEAIWDLF